MRMQQNAILTTTRNILFTWTIMQFCLCEFSSSKSTSGSSHISKDLLEGSDIATATTTTSTSISAAATSFSYYPLHETEIAHYSHAVQEHFRFKHGIYNASIPENSIGKTYAKFQPHEDLAGLVLTNPYARVTDIKYRIIAGDRDKLFKAEQRTVGGFAFLIVCTRTSNVVLNREKNDEYLLRIKATIMLSRHDVSRLSSNSSSTIETDTSIRIRVLDRNDLSPLFYPTEYSKTIPEDMPLHRSILSVMAEDADLGINGEIYYSFLNDNDYFSIHPTTGVITLVRQLHYVDTSHFELMVLAIDRGSAINRNNHQASKAKVSIDVEQVNLYAPQIYVKTFTSTSVDAHSLVYGIVRVTDKDTGRHGEVKKLEIIDGNPDKVFRIKPSGTPGEYYIQMHRLARLASNVYNLTLRAEDNGTPPQFSYKTVPINVQTKANHLPVFSKQLYEISIPESSPPNMPVLRLKVADPDMGKNALVYVEIVGGNEGGEFRINPDTGMLYTQRKLDAENKSFYTLTVSAIDQANIGTRAQSSAKVKINIEDINDNDPVFEDMNTTIVLDENKLAGTYVTKVLAKDRDSGENAYISYSIANLMDVPFEIDHFTGVIKTRSLIDFETMCRQFILSVRASDWGLPYRRQSQLDLVINIKDINDNRPQFERINCVGKVLRSAPVGTDIFTLSAIDFDSGDYITYRLVAGNEDGCFNLDSTTGVLSVGCDLIDVGVAERILNVSATDGTHFSDDMSIKITLVYEDSGSLNDGMDSLDMLKSYGTFECVETGVARRLAEILATAEKNNANASASKLVPDLALTPSRYRENVHAPELVHFPMGLEINESIALGETVALIRGRDRDQGYNGKLVYAISDGDYDSVFRVDSDTGELQIIGYLDRERQDEYVLNITVYDLGEPQKSESQMLPVTILDCNDNPPVFQKPMASFRLPENALNGTVIFCLNASDADANNNGKIAYLMKTETSDFYVNSTTGCIYVNNTLDREQHSEYELHLVARDFGSPPLRAEAIVSITIDDINDNAPVFGVDEFIFKVREDVPRGTSVATIEAIDFDSGPNGEVYYSLKEDDIENGLFKIDKHSGVISTQGYLDYETRQVHNLIVSAIDRGTPSLTSDMPVAIEVIDVNENRFAPEFDDFVYTAHVQENVPKGSWVANITARDLDTSEPDSKISYSIRGGDGLGVFTVNNEGSIHTLSQLDAETKRSYWITLCAQDQAVVPLSSCVQVYIKVDDVNDNVPLTEKPVYYYSILEGSPSGTVISTLEATDEDNDPNQRITFRIIAGNPEGFFMLNSSSGELITTERKLDRENQAEHVLEVSVSDNGDPPLSSTTRVVITVEDINDHSPEFDQRFYKVQVPSNISLNQSIFQIQALDEDIEENGRITYHIKSGKGKNKFHIDPNTGFLYVLKPLEGNAEYELNIRADDNGTPKRGQNARLNIVVVPILEASKHPPLIKTVDNIVDVTESDRPGFLVTLIQAIDEDDDHLWYNISDGDPRNEFYVGRDNGNILLSKSLDWETQQSYNLTITVTDGTHIAKTQLYVQVVDTNDNRPQFAQSLYHVNISENIEEETIILQLHAIDKDEDKKIFYTLHAAQDPASLSLFRIDSLTGNVIVTQGLDYEKTKQHALIAIARDQGTPAKRDYAKIIITVHDHNDHQPEFTSKLIQSKLPESAALGTKVVQLNALDRDCGKNGEIKYSIVSGNMGNVFEIDPALGIITLAKNIDLSQNQEYMLQAKATDFGEPPLSSQIPVHIIVVMTEIDPPRFQSIAKPLEIYENLPIGTFVAQVKASSTSSVFYDIINGNEDVIFHINPSTGIIVTSGELDYETKKTFNLTISATNMASISSTYSLLIHVLDVNDNAPSFTSKEYVGIISEGAEIGSFVSMKNSTKNNPLVLKTLDLDSGSNAITEYNIIDDTAKSYFQVDTLTGTIKLLKPLDYETIPEFKFKVMANDMGVPKLNSNVPSDVHILIQNINDCEPVFQKKDRNVILYLPTYDNVIVTQVNATDADLDENTKIRYDIVDGNTDDCFQIDPFSGVLTTKNIERLGSIYTLHIRASDGLHSSLTQVEIRTELIENPEFVFQKSKYEFSTVENTTKISTIGLVNVVGSTLNENIFYQILNPTNMFRIGSTSGAIETTGIVFDRELQENYSLAIEAKSISIFNGHEYVRRAHVVAHIVILDINDNCPMFVNLPYYATVSVDDPKGLIITSVKAVDMDAHENGEVRYEMKKGNGELFKIDRKSGELSLKQSVEMQKNDYELTVSAYDGAITPCSTDIVVHIKVVDKSMPIFDKQFYSGNVREDIEIYSALLVNIKAESPLQRKLIYTISSGNNDELFEIDYRTGIIYVASELDYEKAQSHQILVRATDGVSGIFAEVTVSIAVIDANDCYPSIEHDYYNVTLLENILPGTEILKVLATDCDTNANSELSYQIESINGKNNSRLFEINASDGTLYVLDNLDFEKRKFHHVVIVVKDHGTPSLSSKANVWITVKDINDNSPKFIEPSFSCSLSVNATRDQFVVITKAFDMDETDNDKLLYNIVDGNDLQTYLIDRKTGIISLQNMHNFTNNHFSILNVSVTDGVHTSYTRVKIILAPENLESPTFAKTVYEASIDENEPVGTHIVTVHASDKDFGKYSKVSYHIMSEEMKEYFSIDHSKGILTSKVSFDREKRKQYELYIRAKDGGGRISYALVKIKINDKNDNPPSFHLKEYKIVVATNTELNKSILKLKTYDLDATENKHLKYEIDTETLNPLYKDYFDLDAKSGDLRIARPINNFSNEIIQFFVRAYDQKLTELTNSVPVSVLFIDPSVVLPQFEKSSMNISVAESTPPGTTLTKFKVSGNFSLKFSVVSNAANFEVTEAGELLLTQTLDREENDLHYVVVMAETATTPPLYITTELYIHVQDENDNYPVFDSAFYNLEIAENDKIKPILKVTAIDLDSGSNGDVRYILEEDASDSAKDKGRKISSVFGIDTYTGWITPLITLDRESQSEYLFNVIATDNGQPKHVSKASVMIKILDYNDNPPAFKKSVYEVSVYENALPGTVLMQFFLTDMDAEKSDVDFSIISGDNSCQFQIGKSGELFVSKPLDRESTATYDLRLLATDGKFIAQTEVLIHVKDVNDNEPVCRTPRYKIDINESIPIGTPLFRVAATDADENGSEKLRYYLTGNNWEHFTVEKNTGVLRVSKMIDRETISKYTLYVHAQDGEELLRECVSEIFITVNDLNDNKPEFAMEYFMVSVSEDAQVETLLTKIHATDKDSGLNRKIAYSFVHPNENFEINPVSGIVKLTKSLDRESIATYNLTIKAEDHGDPKLISNANLIINVLDINDNPPEFEQREYLAHVAENATSNTEVFKAYASSKDIGINAEVSYYIVGGNEQKKFAMNARTGVITVNGDIDYEKTKTYMLTIQAIDGGTPPLSNLATVNISILDINDNSPKFTQNMYRVKIAEDMAIGEHILQLRATDEDSYENAVIKYNIERGDRLRQFTIDESSGSLYVLSALDRETMPRYMLEVRACDSGIPKLCSFTHVNIDILDANDNPPIFSRTNYSLVLQESKDLGYVILNFEVSDADISPNTSPFTFDIRMGNEGGMFRLEQDGSLRTAARFNHHLRDQYTLLVRVFDNGTPPLYSDAWVNITIIEESQYPPFITPLEISVNSYEDDFTGGMLGRVYASDQDKYDVLLYDLAPTIGEHFITRNLFSISRENGSLYAVSNIDVGLYKINVTVTDGKFTSNAIVKVNVELVTVEMVKNALVMTFADVTPEEFILSHRKEFIRLIRAAMRCRQKDISIVTIHNSTNSIYRNQIMNEVGRSRRSTKLTLDVVFAVRKQQIIPNSEVYFSPREIHDALIKQLETRSEVIDLTIENIMVPECSKSSCVNGVCTSRVILYKKNLSTYTTDVISFVAPTFGQVEECLCKEGFDGANCDEPVNACSSNPCPPQRQCLPAESAVGFQCVCPSGFSGQFCETALIRCLNSSCINALTSVSFNGKSYAHYKVNKALSKTAMENQFIYSLKVRTVQQTGTLLYASGRVDFNVLEIVNGCAQYRFDLGSGEGNVRVSSIYISDGQWHTIHLERVLNSAKLIVDNKHASQSSAPGVNGILNTQSNDIFVGAEIKQHSSIIGFEDIQRGYIGCMADIKIAYEPLPLYISGGSSIASLKRFTNVEFTCDPSSVLVSLGVCGAQPCLNGGVCIDEGNSSFICECHSRFSGRICEVDLDPCASNPCLLGGICTNLGLGNYSCNCPLHLSGKRCEYGKFCLPNPCQNGGVCEEGDGMPHCLCRGYTGPTCELDVDECENQPCGNGATCINEAGSFRCICPSYLTGASCGDPLYSISLSTKLRNLSREHYLWIITLLVFIAVIVVCTICGLFVRKNSRNRNRNRSLKIKTSRKTNYKEDNLNALLNKENFNKQNQKLSNLEVNQRPLSYTSPGNDIYANNSTALNNLDLLQSYGSAGDELETIPFEYQKINRTYQKININGCNLSETDSSSTRKNSFEQMHLKTFTENKLNNEKNVEKLNNGQPFNRLKPSSKKLVQVSMPNVCRSSYTGDPSSSPGQYHWDCSDWIRKSHNPLPDITEVPSAEVADSSSFHSDDSNESKVKNSHIFQNIGRVNPERDITTLNEDGGASEYADSEMEACSQPFIVPLLNTNHSISRLNSHNENEDYTLNTDMMYLHPDSYLPTMNVPSETEGESSVNGFPYVVSSAASTAAPAVIDVRREPSISYSLERSGYKNDGSTSDLSVHLCEIEDSELEEFLPTEERRSKSNIVNK